MPLRSPIRLRRISRQLPWRAVSISVTATILAVALLWPVLMTITVSGNINWHALSEVGQAYGAVSAVLSGLALCGVVVSLLIQRRQAQTSTQYAIRERHFDLLRLMLDQPDLMYGFAMDPRDPAARRSVYVNLIIGHMHMTWMLGEAEEIDLRNALREMFRGSTAMDWWSRGGGEWTVDPRPRSRQFLRIIQEEYKKAVMTGPPLVAPDDIVTLDSTDIAPNPPVSTHRTVGPPVLVAAAIGMAVGAALGKALRSPGRLRFRGDR
jgi:hypothetical protein